MRRHGNDPHPTSAGRRTPPARKVCNFPQDQNYILGRHHHDTRTTRIRVPTVPHPRPNAAPAAVATMRVGTTTINRTSVALTLLAISMLFLLALLRQS